MITAMEETRLQHGQRSKSAASGPLFSVPALPGIGEMWSATTPAALSAVAGCAEGASSAPSTSLDLAGFIGRSVGSGQCVALVLAALPSLGPSSTWTEGASVQGNAALSPGTPVATFDPSSRYANATDGSSHAAIYLGQDAQGIKVLDQWHGRAAAVRTIPWDNPGASAANTGSAFRVVRPARS